MEPINRCLYDDSDDLDEIELMRAALKDMRICTERAWTKRFTPEDLGVVDPSDACIIHLSFDWDGLMQPPL